MLKGLKARAEATHRANVGSVVNGQDRGGDDMAQSAK